MQTASAMGNIPLAFGVTTSPAQHPIGRPPLRWLAMATAPLPFSLILATSHRLGWNDGLAEKTACLMVGTNLDLPTFCKQVSCEIFQNRSAQWNRLSIIALAPMLLTEWSGPQCQASFCPSTPIGPLPTLPKYTCV